MQNRDGDMIFLIFYQQLFKCHPNYAAYLMRRETLDIENIEKILSLIPIDERKEFDESLIEGLYIKFQSSEIDDKKASIKLRDMIAGREDFNSWSWIKYY